MNKALIVDALLPVFKDFEFNHKPIEVAGLSSAHGGIYTLKIYTTWLNELENYSDRVEIIVLRLFRLVPSNIIRKINIVYICESREEIDDIDIIYQKDNIINIEDFLITNGFELDTYYQSNKNYCKKITDCQTLHVRVYSDVNTIEKVKYEYKGLDKYDKDNTVVFETINTLTKLKCLLEALL
jgi:hypothetical protein